ncbi:MAG: hypothetical protein AMXMBFR56_67910 [Polyangiaceae bacterium]
MSKMIDYLKASAGEASLLTRLGFWRQAVSLTVDQLVDLVQLISGGGLLPATGTTQGSRPLSGYNTALLQTGDEVFVQGINELYYFDATSALAADGLNVVNAVGPGQFIRSSSVIVQADWYVDSVNGDDENPGTAALPLQTLRELSRRWAGRVLGPSIVTATITLLGTFPTEVLALNATWARGQIVVVTGTTTELATGTITTYTARNPGANASATILADISFAALVKKRVRLTSGASVGATGWVLADVGGNTCRVSCVQLSGNGVAPANGTTFSIEEYPTTIGGVATVCAGGGQLFVRDLNIAAGSDIPNYMLGNARLGLGASYTAGSCFDRCFFTATFRGFYGFGMNGCATNAANILSSGLYYLQAHTQFSFSTWLNATVDIGTSSSSYMCIESINTSINLIALTGQSVVQQRADIQMFGCTTTVAALLVTDDSTWAYQSGVNIFGSGNTFPTAVQVRSGSHFLYVTNKPAIVGATQDALVGGTPKAWAAIPYVEVANGAMIVVRQ